MQLTQRLFIVLFSISLSLNAQYTKLLDFDWTTTGANPTGSLYYDGTDLYGLTGYGGMNGQGVLFKVKPDGTGFTKLFEFSGTLNGSNPLGSLMYDGTYFYGTTNQGGTNNFGTIFKIKKDGSGFTKLLDFDGTNNGRLPRGSLISDGTYLYGTTGYNGTNQGSVFKIKLDGSGYTTILDFNTTNGSIPNGSVVSDGIYLYGMTYQGGTSNGQNDGGVLYKVKTDGSSYAKLIDFTGPNGKTPTGSLVFDGTFLYGMTKNGGTFNQSGIIFKIKPDGTSFQKLLDFEFAKGANPYGDLLFDGTYLYGLTHTGGNNVTGNILGTMFRINKDGTNFIKLFDFDGPINGAHPQGHLISDGTFLFGMTTNGGANNSGVLFKYAINAIQNSVNVYKSVPEYKIFPIPASSFFNVELSEYCNGCRVQVINLFGEEVLNEVLQSTNSIINTKQLNTGLYFLNIIRNGETIATKKVLIE